MAGREYVEITFKGDSASAVKAAATARAAIESLDDSTVHYNVSVGDTAGKTDKATKSLAKFNVGTMALRNTLMLIKWPAIASGVSLLAQALTAAGAGAVGLTSALGPLIGSLTGAASAMGGFAQAMGTGMLAMKGLSEAIKATSEAQALAAKGGEEYKAALENQREAMKDLTKEQRVFVMQIVDMKPKLDALKQTAAKGLLPGLGKGIESASKNFGVLRGVIRETGEQMGQFATNFGKLLGSKGFGRDFEVVGSRNAKVLGAIGDAVINLVSALRHVMVVADPFIAWMQKGVKGWGDYIEKVALVNRKNGDMADFFKTAKDAMKDWGAILQSLSSGLYEVFKAASPLGKDIVDSWREGAESFEKWAESVSGQKSLAKFFKDMKPPLYELGRLVRDLGAAFLEIGTDDPRGLTGIIRQLRKELLPVIVDVLKVAGRMGPVFVDALTQTAELFNTLVMPNGGVLTIFLETLTTIAKTLNWAFREIPGLGEFASVMLTLVAVTKALKFTAAISGAKMLWGWLTKAYGVMKGMTALSAAQGLMTGPMAPGMGGAPTTVAKGGKVAGFFGNVATAARGGLAGIGAGGMAGVAAAAIPGAALAAVGLIYEQMHTSKAEAFTDSLEGLQKSLKRTAEEGRYTKEALEKVNDRLHETGEEGESWKDRHTPGSRDLGKFGDAVSKGRDFMNDNPLLTQRPTAYAGGPEVSDAELPDAIAKRRLGSEAQEALGPLKQLREEWGNLSAAAKDFTEADKRGFKVYAAQLKQRYLITDENYDRMIAVVENAGARIGDDSWSKNFQSNVKALRGGYFTTLGQISKATKENMAEISGAYRKGSGEWRKLTAQSMKAQNEAIRKGMKRGEIEHKEGLEQIRKNIHQSKILEATRKQAREFGNEWGKGMDRAEKFTGKGVDNIIGDLRKMESGSRTAALKTWFEQLKAAKENNPKLKDEFRSLRAKIVDEFGEGAIKAIRSTNDMNKGVMGSVTDLTKGVTSGLGGMVNQLSGILKQLGVDKIDFSVKTEGGNKRQAGGRTVGGHGQGDKVHLLAEPGEVVWNREAVRKMGGEDIANLPNYLYPRFPGGKPAARQFGGPVWQRRATGGMVDPAGPGTGVVNAAIAPVVGRWSTKYDAAINYGYDPGGGHQSAGHNITGTATDTGPAGGWGTEPRALFEQGLKVALAAGLTVLYGSHGIGTPYDGHGGPEDAGSNAHAHIEWGMHPSLKGIGTAAAVEMIKRRLLLGPDGRLKDSGQSALDGARKAMNDYIAKHSGSAMPMGEMGRPISSLPDSLKKWNRTFPVTSGFGDGYAMPFDHVAALAEWSGTPGVSMARTAIGESQLEPGAKGFDPGGSIGWGLQMVTTGVGNDAMINSYGGGPQMLNPVKNEMAAAEIWKGSGWGAWYSQTKDTSNTHYTGALLKQLGGVLRRQGGGGSGDGKDKPEDTGPDDIPKNTGNRIKDVRKALQQIKKSLRRSGLTRAVREKLMRRKDELQFNLQYLLNMKEMGKKKAKLKRVTEEGMMKDWGGRINRSASGVEDASEKLARLSQGVEYIPNGPERVKKATLQLLREQMHYRRTLIAGIDVAHEREKHARKKSGDIHQSVPDLDKTIEHLNKRLESDKFKGNMSKEDKELKEELEKRVDKLEEIKKEATEKETAWDKAQKSAGGWAHSRLHEDLWTLHGRKSTMRDFKGPFGANRPKYLTLGGEIGSTQTSLKGIGVTETEQEKADNTIALLRDEVAKLRLAISQAPVFNDLLSENLPYVGTYERGTDYVPRTGLAMVHKGEGILTREENARGGSVTVNLYGDIAPLVKAEVAGATRTIDKRIGQRGRQIQVAPGRAR